MKKIWKHLFNQNMLYILLMLVQIAFLVLSVLFLNRNYAWVYGALLLLNGLLIIYITNSRKNPTYKNAWLVVIAVLPIFGGLSYLFLKTRRDTRIFFRNSINNGLLLIENSDIQDVIKEGDSLTVNMGESLEFDGKTYPIHPLPDNLMDIINAGGLVKAMQKRNGII